MKQILIIIFTYFFLQDLYAQADSVFLSIDSKLIREVQIITPNDQSGTRENYTYFKARYWLGKIDTVSMSLVHNNQTEKSKNKEIIFEKLGACDSIINQIRNSADYWKMYNETSEIARKEIGDNNDEFNKFKYSEKYNLNDLSKKCRIEFRIEIAELKAKFIEEISRIKEDKYQRYTQLKETPDSIDSESIKLFFETYDVCETDLKTLELIILESPGEFVDFIDRMNDSEFFTFTLQLGDFAENTNISKMKQSLRELEHRSKRKQKVLRKIKKSKS